jgi:hypothetical protein
MPRIHVLSVQMTHEDTNGAEREASLDLKSEIRSSCTQDICLSRSGPERLVSLTLFSRVVEDLVRNMLQTKPDMSPRIHVLSVQMTHEDTNGAEREASLDLKSD